MKSKHHKLLRAGLLLALAGGWGTPGFSQTKESSPAEPVTILEKFIVSESANAAADTLLPTSRPVDSLYGFARELIDTPRSVSVITPEALSQRGITNVNELVALVPGATVTNYYGVPGIPTTHGLFTSIYFNGMQRVWNRNGYPTSFGSLESMDFVKGPAPATYSAASPGGYVNFLPKSPYYDKYRGSLRFSYGSHQEFNTQVDVGGPFLLGANPAAFRISVTNQQADSYYQGIKNDYVSFYGSLKARLSDSVSLYAGGEFYRHRSKENPGWNRVTQNLIDHDQYLVGTPLNDLTAPTLTLTLPSGKVFTWVNDTPGFVSRPALETATPFGGSRGQFGGSFLSMNGFSGSGFSLAKVAASADASYLYTYLGAINNPTGKTVKLDGGRVLTDLADFTNADTYLFFFDTVFSPSTKLKVTNKFFIDAYTREKLSSYGYGELGKNFTVENKILVEQSLPVLGGLNLAYGVSARYEDSLAKTEFTVEPFSRRDISVGPTLNDTLKSGGQRGNTGRTYWDPFGSWDTQLLTAGVFLTPELKLSDAFSVLFSARWDNASWKRAVPFGLAFDSNSGPKTGGGTSYTNYSVSPVLKLSPNVTLYATAQKGTSFQGFYVSGSVDRGDTNFQESSIAEVGLKTSLLDKKLFAAADVFYQELVNFDARGGAAIPQRGKGVEFETTWVVSPKLSITANAAWQQHFFRSATIPGGFVPLTEADYLKYAALFYADFGGRPNPGGPRFGIPEYTAGVFVKYDFGNGFGINGGPNYTASVWGNPDKTLKLPAYTLWNAAVYYSTPRWQVQISGKNLFSARYFNPYDAFSANAMILKGEPLHVTGTFTYKF